MSFRCIGIATMVFFGLVSTTLFAQPKEGTRVRKYSLETDNEIQMFGGMLQGTYTTFEQAAKDPTHDSLRLTIQRIWHTNTDAYWLYAEYFKGTDTTLMPVQYVYKIQRADNVIELTRFGVKADHRNREVWLDSTRVTELTPLALHKNRGCEIYIKYGQGMYYGTTMGMACAGTQPGISYTTNELQVWADRIIQWERGYNSGGEQIWGAKSGAYHFVRTL